MRGAGGIEYPIRGAPVSNPAALVRRKGKGGIRDPT